MLDTITTDDVIRAGACPDGVSEWYAQHGRGMTAMSTRLALAACKTDEDRRHILRAAKADGDGNGFGDGNGNGFGDGNGDGDGNGFGDGDGNGFGDGYGYGFGYGNGYGYGDGDGDGDGDGGLLYHHRHTETP